jgi:hypothetical protein
LLYVLEIISTIGGREELCEYVAKVAMKEGSRQEAIKAKETGKHSGRRAGEPQGTQRQARGVKEASRLDYGVQAKIPASYARSPSCRTPSIMS